MAPMHSHNHTDTHCCKDARVALPPCQPHLPTPSHPVSHVYPPCLPAPPAGTPTCACGGPSCAARQAALPPSCGAGQQTASSASAARPCRSWRTAHLACATAGHAHDGDGARVCMVE
eukprot:357723-Chlamydomonas_euryale.AAC.5